MLRSELQHSKLKGHRNCIRCMQGRTDATATRMSKQLGGSEVKSRHERNMRSVESEYFAKSD